MKATSRNKLRTRVIPVRVTEEMYSQLTDLAFGYDLPISTYCYLAVRKALSFQREVMHADDVASEDLIP